MGYRIGALAGDSLRKTYTHKDFAILKFSLIQGLKENDLNYVCSSNSYNSSNLSNSSLEHEVPLIPTF